MTISKQTHFVSDLINQAGFPSRAGPIYQLIKELTGARQETITQWYIETPAQINVQPLGPALPSPAAITTHYHQTNDTIPLMVSVSTSRLNLHFHINPTFFWSFTRQIVIVFATTHYMKLTTPCWHTQLWGLKWMEDVCCCTHLCLKMLTECQPRLVPVLAGLAGMLGTQSPESEDPGSRCWGKLGSGYSCTPCTRGQWDEGRGDNTGESGRADAANITHTRATTAKNRHT